MKIETLNTESSTAPSTAKSRAYLIVTALVALTTLAGGVIGACWLLYRSDHVVINDATIKGTIARLGARLDCQVKDILVSPGERVQKGQVLIRLEDQHLQAAMQLAQAAFETATNELHSEELAIAQERRRLPNEVEKAESMLKASAAVLEGAQSEEQRLVHEFERISILQRQGMTSTSELDQITGQRGRAGAAARSAASLKDAAQGSLQAAKLELEALHVREAHLGVLQSQISLGRAKLAAAQADLNASVLRAPDDGWVVERIVEAGGSAKVGEPILSLWVGRPWVEAWASEKALRHLEIGSKARVSLDAFPRQPLGGRIMAFGLLTDKELLTHPVPTTLDSLVHKGAMVRLCIALDDDNIRLQPGLSAVVGIEKRAPKPNEPQEPVLGNAKPSVPTFASGREATRSGFKSTE